MLDGYGGASSRTRGWGMSDGWLGTAGARIGRAVGVRLEDGDIAIAEEVERMALAMLRIREASGLTDDATDMEVASSVQRALALRVNLDEPSDTAPALRRDAARLIGALAAERDEARAERDALRTVDRRNSELRAEVERLRAPAPESLYAGSPADDGRALRSLLDGLGVPLSEHSDAVRVAWVVGRYGAAGGER